MQDSSTTQIPSLSLSQFIQVLENEEDADENDCEEVCNEIVENLETRTKQI